MVKRKTTAKARAAQAKKPKNTKVEEEEVASDDIGTVKVGAEKVKVHVVFWRKFQGLEKELEKLFPEALQITSEKTATKTGWFEVSVNGEVVHSRKNGDGHVDKPDKLEKVSNAINALLKKGEVEA